MQKLSGIVNHQLSSAGLANFVRKTIGKLHIPGYIRIDITIEKHQFTLRSRGNIGSNAYCLERILAQINRHEYRMLLTLTATRMQE